MARTVSVLRSYTGVRSRLSRLEIAVEKDERVSAEDRANVREHIRKLVTLLMGLDDQLPVVPGRRKGRQRKPGKVKAPGEEVS